MAHRPRFSLLHRLLRAGTAAVTVWCLGCSAFDPLLSQLAGGSTSGMVCAGDERGGASGAASNESTSDDKRVRATPTDEGRSGGAICDCQSCTAPSPSPLLAVIPSPTLPRLAPVLSATPSSRDTEPLVPPPQLAS
jgi:hypothetical protein